MIPFDIDPAVAAGKSPSLLPSEIDAALTAQLLVAWAGEGGEAKRLGWWRSDFVSEYGGIDLFQRLLPATWGWAVLQGAREAARRKDAELRRQDHDPDAILSLFFLGFEWDEHLDERFQDLKRAGLGPDKALPGLAECLVRAHWDASWFLNWVQGHGRVEMTSAPIGRRLKADVPATLDQIVTRLVAGLSPLADAYPLPHYRRER